MANSKADEACAEQFLISRGLVPERFAGKDTRRRTKTPDFKVSATTGEFFYCEQKSVYTETGKGGILHRTICNSLTDNIHQAVSQFRSVNSRRFVPNVLIWISHNVQINERRLVELWEGCIKIGDLKIADLSRFRLERFRREFDDIDLHIWLYSDGVPQFILNAADQRFARLLSKIFQIRIDTVSQG